MMKLKSRFTKNPGDLTQDVPCANDDYGTLKRSNAKLRRPNRDSTVFDAVSSVADLPGHPPVSVSSLILPMQDQPVNAESAAEASEDVQYEIVRVPVPGTLYQTTEVRRPIKPKSKSKSRWFSSKHKSQKQEPAACSKAEKAKNVYVESDADYMPAEQDAVVDPYRDAMAVRADWAARNNDDANRKSINGKGKQPQIFDGPEEENDLRRIRDYMRQYSLGSQEEAVSPADSGIDMEGEDGEEWHTAQSIVSIDQLDATAANLASAQDKMDTILAEEAALEAEIERCRQEREDALRDEALRKDREEQERKDRIHAIALQKEQDEQDWNDRLEAIRIQKHQARERKLQEELDRQEAVRLQQEEEEEEEEKARLAAEEEECNRPRDCICCGDSEPHLTFPARPATSSCEHDSQTCIDCMQSWLAAEFESKGTEDLKCPECPATLEYSSFQLHASPETFVSYEKMLTRNALSQLEEFAWCLSPTCDSGQLNVQESDDLGGYMDCSGCGYKQCLRHKIPWHSNESCEQYDYRTSGKKAADEEKLTEEMLDSVSKKCPGMGCGWRIQKIDGCDHMKCKKCKFEFCWECLASHKEIKRVGNTAHQSWCKFHSHNLDVAWPFNVHS